MKYSLCKNLDHIGPDTLPNPVITIGNFDGLHRGHKKIIEEVIRKAESVNGTPVLLTFNPHPLKVFKGDHNHLITTLEQKVALAHKAGIEEVFCIEFSKELAGQSPEEFVRNFIYLPFKPKDIFVGHDFNFGKGRTGTPEYLQSLETTFDFRVHIIDEILCEGQRISSSVIRRMLEAGDIEKASVFLGHDYFLDGEVIKGNGLGRKLGFPTANIKTENEIIPTDGVYAGYSLIEGIKQKAVINIGVRPTVESRGERTIEAFYIDLDSKTDLYGNRLKLHFLRRLRGEQKFANIEELRNQIQRDCEEAGKTG